jgi:hypothetical protein
MRPPCGAGGLSPRFQTGFQQHGSPALPLRGRFGGLCRARTGGRRRGGAFWTGGNASNNSPPGHRLWQLPCSILVYQDHVIRYHLLFSFAPLLFSSAASPLPAMCSFFLYIMLMSFSLLAFACLKFPSQGSSATIRPRRFEGGFLRLLSSNVSIATSSFIMAIVGSVGEQVIDGIKAFGYSAARFSITRGSFCFYTFRSMAKKGFGEPRLRRQK